MSWALKHEKNFNRWRWAGGECSRLKEQHGQAPGPEGEWLRKNRAAAAHGRVRPVPHLGADLRGAGATGLRGHRAGPRLQEQTRQVTGPRHLFTKLPR